MHPHFYMARYVLANALGHIERYEEAKAEMATTLTINPYITEALLAREWQVITRDPEMTEIQLGGLRKAGIYPPLPAGVTP
jgi:hypothetical protein